MNSTDSKKLRADLKTVIEDAEALIKNASAPASDDFRSTRERVEATLKNAKDELIRIERMIVDKTKEAAATTDHYVKDNPWQAAGLAAAIGLVVGLLIRRK